jgi:hypothetical protein
LPAAAPVIPGRMRNWEAEAKPRIEDRHREDVQQ